MTTTMTLDYAKISPSVLANRIERDFNCFCFYHDMNEDRFSFTVTECDNLEAVNRILEAYK